MASKRDAKAVDPPEGAVNSDMDGKDNNEERFSPGDRTKDFGTEVGTEWLANQETYFTAGIGFPAITK